MVDSGTRGREVMAGYETGQKTPLQKDLFNINETILEAVALVGHRNFTEIAFRPHTELAKRVASLLGRSRIVMVSADLLPLPSGEFRPS